MPGNLLQGILQADIQEQGHTRSVAKEVERSYGSVSSKKQMIESPERVEDEKAKKEALELMEFSLRKYQETGDKQYLERAKEFGGVSAKYTEMLKGDYTERDKKWAIYHKLNGI